MNPRRICWTVLAFVVVVVLLVIVGVVEVLAWVLVGVAAAMGDLLLLHAVEYDRRGPRYDRKNVNITRTLII